MTKELLAEALAEANEQSVREFKQTAHAAIKAIASHQKSIADHQAKITEIQKALREIKLVPIEASIFGEP